MTEKIDKLAGYLEANNSDFPCTMMVIYDLFEVHYLPIPCSDKILEEGAVFCMHTFESYYETEGNLRKASKAQNVMRSYKTNNNNSTGEGTLPKQIVIGHYFVCNDKTLISVFSICDGKSHCEGNEDEWYCHYFDALVYPQKLFLVKNMYAKKNILSALSFIAYDGDMCAIINGNVLGELMR